MKKLKGNTLPEVLIAIVIISFTSALGLLIFSNIQQNTQPFQVIKANEIALKYLKEANDKQDYFDADYKEDDFIIKKTMLRCETYPDCLILKISVSKPNEKKKIDLQQLIHAN